MTRKVHVVGRKNAGKTTLVADLVRELSSRGKTIGTIKHSHHHHEFDAPGKDSYLHRKAGASVVGLVGPKMSAAFREHHEDDQTQGIEHLMPLFKDCDFIIVEGQQGAEEMKIEVWRKETDQPPLASERSDIIAVISDDSVPNVACPIWPRHSINELADRVESMMSRD